MNTERNQKGGLGQDGCRKCGQMGHFARECQNNAASSNNVPSSSREFGGTSGETASARPAVTYIPVEANLDQLWNQHIYPGINFERSFDIPVQVSGGDTNVSPIDRFLEADLSPCLLENLVKCDYEKPTPIQKYAIPYIARGRDVMGCAQTGSGKTAAYLLPLLSSILKRGEDDAVPRPVAEPVAIIVSPTRELAIQIKDEARKFAAGTMIAIKVIYGGTNVRAQVDKIRNGCNVLVATVGRLMQFIDENLISLQKCRFVVLDEADRMLDMNFEQTIRRLMDLPEMPPKGEQRQTLMFSATFRPEIQQLAHDFLHQHVFVTVGKLGGANQDVIQGILHVPIAEKYDKLYDLILQDLHAAAAAGAETVTKTLVFVERRRVADFVASRMSLMGLPTTSIHGDREQREREIALNDFKSGKCPVLVATAVASRGLDIVGVDHVINFDMPQTIDDYVHRIGRTGRVGNHGRATSFYDPHNDKDMVTPLLQVLVDAKQDVPDWFLAEAGENGENVVNEVKETW